MQAILEDIHFTTNAWILGLPSLFMGMDVLTGLTYAWVSKTFDSTRMRQGLGKKFGEISYLVIGIAVTYAMAIPKYILVGIAVYILFMELMSIIENCDRLGAPVPKFVRDVVNNLGDALQNGDLDDVKDSIEHPTKGDKND